MTEPREAPQIPDITPSWPTSPTTCMSTTASVIWVLALPYTWPHTPAVASITQLAEILNIQDNTQMSTMVTANALTAQIGRIDSNMGHKFTAEDAAWYWAMGVDRSDPPHNPWVGWWITTNQAGGLPPPELPLPRRGGGIFRRRQRKSPPTSRRTTTRQHTPS